MLTFYPKTEFGKAELKTEYAERGDSMVLSPEGKINRFVEDICCLDSVTEYDSEFNFFRALGLSTNEICHSGFLAWLIDPHGNHGLGSYMLKKLVGQDNMDWDSFTVRREWEKIDILAVSDKGKYVLCIENKIGTGEHTNQCGRYKATTNIYFPDYRKELLFLTPNGRKSSDPKNWRSMSYTDILEIIDGANLDELASDVSIVIRHYMDMLRRDIVGDEELKKICQKIYVKHKGALDLIIANKPHSAKVKETLRMWAEDKAEKGEIQLDLSEKTYMRFTTPAMSKIIPDSEKPDSDWKTKNHYFYEIWVKEPDHDFFMQIALNTTNISAEQRSIFDHIMELRKDVQVAGKGAKYLNPFVAKHQDWYCLESDDTMTGNLNIQGTLYPSLCLLPTNSGQTNRIVFEGSYVGAASFAAWEDSTGNNRRMLEVRTKAYASSLDNAVMVRVCDGGTWGNYRVFHAGMPSGVPVANGGTGATTAANARSNLGANNASNLTTGTLPAARLPFKIQYGQTSVTGVSWTTVTLSGFTNTPTIIVSYAGNPTSSGIAVLKTGSESASSFQVCMAGSSGSGTRKVNWIAIGT